MSRKMWFGNTQHAQWVPAPAPGMTRGREGYSEELAFQNGGLWLEESAGSHVIYGLELPVGDASEYEGIEAFARFAAREYGPDYLRFVDPMFSDINLFDPRWAAPALIEQGWKNFGANAPTFSATGANIYGKPARKATWAIDSAANAVFGKAFTFLIPPGYTLSLGGSGAVTGTAALRVLPYGGVAASIALSADAAPPAFTTTVDGSVNSSATVFLARTTTAASTATLTALWAQVRPTGQAATITRHLPGQGSAGLRFRGKVMPEVYEMTRGHRVGMSATLAEVETWE